LVLPVIPGVDVSLTTFEADSARHQHLHPALNAIMSTTAAGADPAT
jgi:hypothetical protein